jgi:hypothetical protein
MCSIAHYDTNSIQAVATNTGIYEEEEEFSFYEHANSIFVGGGQLLSLYRHTFIMIWSNPPVLPGSFQQPNSVSTY